MESFVNLVFIPNWFNIWDPNLSLGLSFLFNSPKSENVETPFAFAAAKNIIKNSSIKLLFRLGEQFIFFKVGWLLTYMSACFSPYLVLQKLN